MIKVTFNSPEEFAAELELGKPNNNILRLTRLIEFSKQMLPIRYISVVGTFLRDGQIVKLVRYCGDHWGNGCESDSKTIERVHKVMTDLEDVARSLKIDVRAG